jgi:hypothetical protein
MKNNLVHVMILPLLVLSTNLSAKETTVPDRATQLLNSSGAISIKAAGPYVENGTYQIQVAAKLGRPNVILGDGAWLYNNFAVADSNATGTLVVRFDQGRVVDLSLVTPAVVAAMRSNRRNEGQALIATK